MTTERYTPDNIKLAVEADVERLFAPWAVGRPENWNPGPETKLTVSLGYWLNEELTKVCANETDRKTQLWRYNRLGRTYDIWQTAADVLNEVLDGNVEQNRRGHRRWG